MAVGASYLASMMKAAGLTASYYNDEVTDLIEQARADMVRAGVLPEMAMVETDPLIKGAIKTFVQAQKAEDIDESGKLMDSYRLQVESLAKSGNYRRESDEV